MSTEAGGYLRESATCCCRDFCIVVCILNALWNRACRQCLQGTSSVRKRPTQLSYINKAIKVFVSGAV